MRSCCSIQIDIQYGHVLTWSGELHMKPYILIKGTEQEIEEFETNVSQALEQGYELTSDLITKVVTQKNGETNIIFIQPMILEEAVEFEEYEEHLA